MSLASADLPSDPDAVRAFALACQSELASANAELQAAKLAIQLRTLEIEKLKFQIAKLRRMQCGRRSERINRQIEQLALQLEELETGEAEDIAKAAAEDPPHPLHQGACDDADEKHRQHASERQKAQSRDHVGFDLEGVREYAHSFPRRKASGLGCRVAECQNRRDTCKILNSGVALDLTFASENSLQH